MMSTFKKYLYPNESQNMPKLWEKTPLSKSRILILLMHYFIGYLFIYPFIMAKISLWLDPNAQTVGIPVQIITYLYVFLVTIVLIWPVIKESWICLKQNRKKIFYIIVGNLILLYIFNLIVSLIITLFTSTPSSNNQTEIVQSIQNQRIITTFLVLIFAPVVEEAVCRGVIFRSLRAHYSFYLCAIISGLVFGFLHCYASLLSGDYLDLIYMPVYGLVGIFMCRVYEQSQSLLGAILFHFVYNSIALLVVI